MDEIKKEEVKVAEVKPVEVSRITYNDWKKIEIKIGKILTVEKLEKSEKLLKLSVDFNEGTPRQIISGIAKYFPDIAVLVNKKCAFVTNLEPKPLMGLESNGMILAVGGGPSSEAGKDEPFSLLEVGNDVLVGTQAK
jgi:methionyl-tRNA synthetase